MKQSDDHSSYSFVYQLNYTRSYSGGHVACNLPVAQVYFLKKLNCSYILDLVELHRSHPLRLFFS
jgi:hypothetical protein